MSEVFDGDIAIHIGHSEWPTTDGFAHRIRRIIEAHYERTPLIAKSTEKLHITDITEGAIFTLQKAADRLEECRDVPWGVAIVPMLLDFRGLPPRHPVIVIGVHHRICYEWMHIHFRGGEQQFPNMVLERLFLVVDEVLKSRQPGTDPPTAVYRPAISLIATLSIGVDRIMQSKRGATDLQ